MWIPKWQRDRARCVESAMPTQVVSNDPGGESALPEKVQRGKTDEQD